jgi:hypothetical protein
VLDSPLNSPLKDEGNGIKEYFFESCIFRVRASLWAFKYYNFFFFCALSLLIPKLYLKGKYKIQPYCGKELHLLPTTNLSSLLSTNNLSPSAKRKPSSSSSSLMKSSRLPSSPIKANLSPFLSPVLSTPVPVLLASLKVNFLLFFILDVL